MIRKSMSKSHLFFIELIIVVLFFSFASIIAINVFIKASNIAHSTTALNGAMVTVQSAAELDKTKPLNELTQRTEYYDKDWDIADHSKAVFTLTTNVVFDDREAGIMAMIDYTVISEEQIVFQLSTQKYYSGNLQTPTLQKEGENIE